MIVRNEERFLDQCLRSVAGLVDEINIIDTGSTDATLEIAARYGARIEHRVWRNDFGWARNEALAMATRRWIIVLDADEELEETSRALVAPIGNVPAYLTGIWLRCLNLSDDYKGTGSSSHALARIFPNHPRLRYHGEIHEFISLDDCEIGIDARLSPIAIRHHGYLADVVVERRKAARNFEIIREAVKARPDEPFNWYNLGNTALLDGRNDEGIEALEKMREIVGERPRGFVAVGLAMLADAHTDFRNDPARAIEIASESLRKSPNFANAHFALGRAYARLERFDEARAAFEAAIADGAYNRQQFVVDDEVSLWKAHSEIGSTYGRQGDNARALEWFEKALLNRPEVQPLMINRARALETLGRMEEATQRYRELYEHFSDDGSTLDYVNFLFRQKRYIDGLRIIDGALASVSDGLARELLVTAAKVAAGIGDGDPSRYFEAALARGCTDAETFALYENHLRERSEGEALARLFAREMQMPCADTASYVRRSSRLLAERHVDEAIRLACEGLALGHHGELAFTAGAGLVLKGDREAALLYLDRVAPTDGSAFAKATYLRSVIAFDLGRTTEALRSVETVLAVHPDAVEAIVHRAKVLETLGRIDDAAAGLRARVDAGDQRFAVELASLYMRHGQFERARSVADEALVGTTGNA